MNIGVRPLCANCRIKPRAYGYRKGNKIYWRRLCDSCIRKKNKKKIGLKPGRRDFQKRVPSHFLIGAGIQERLFSQQWDIVLRTNINTL